MSRRGRFIVIDGGEGSGKTTMIKTLEHSLPARKILTTHEPGGTPFADSIRGLFLSEEALKAPVEAMFSLVWGGRAEHIKNKIKPALESGQSVVCDRFDSSTFAYQIFAQESPHLEKLFWDTRKIFLRGCEPYTYIFFDINPEVGLKRVAERKGEITHFDNKELFFHERVRRGFSEFFKKVPHKVIDASQPLDKVKAEFLRLVSRLLD